MKDINLLPKIEKQKKKGSFLFNLFLIILLVLLVISLGLSYYFGNIRKELSGKFDIIEKTNFDLNLYKDKLLFYKNFEENVNYKAALNKSLNSETIKWSQKFYDLSRILPEKAYILSFNGRCDNLYTSIESVKNGGDIPKGKLLAFNIEGYSNDYVEISRLILGLKEISEITDPWIASIKETEVENLKLLYFKVEVYWDLDEFIKDIEINKEPALENTDELDIEKM